MLLFNRWYYYDELMQYADQLQRQHPDLITMENIGYSHDGRKIPYLEAGCGTKRVLCVGGVHGRETINPVILLYMLSYYAGLFKQDGCIMEHYPIRQLLHEYRIGVIPLLNPDGYMIALRGYNVIRDEQLRLRAKAKEIPYAEWKYNGRGIDLNRNFPALTWRKKFEGDNPGSENETKALIEVFKHYPSIAFLDYHSRGEMIYYYRNEMSDAYNDNQYTIAKKLANLSDYVLVDPSDEIETGDTGGNTVHHYAETYKNPALTIETVYEYAGFPLNPKYQKKTFAQICLTPFVFAL